PLHPHTAHQKTNGAGLRTHRRRLHFSVCGRYQSTFSLRFGLMTSNVMGCTGATTPFFLSSRSSCPLDFCLALLSFASPRPLGMHVLPSGGSIRTRRAYRPKALLSSRRA